MSSDPYENPVYSGMVPAQMRGMTIGDKGSAKVQSNQMGFTGGMVAAYPPVVTYDGHDWYHFFFETVSVPSIKGDPSSPLVQMYNHEIEVHRHQRDNEGNMSDIHAGGGGTIFPFIHQSDRQLKLYVLHFPGDNQDRQIRILRTGIYY